MASLIHGHAPPAIVEAVTRQIGRGTAYTLATEVEIRFAEHLRARNPGFEKIRFVNSGTEAVMVAVKAARAFTGRPKVAKVEGAYHGTYDYAEVSQTSSPSNWGTDEDPASVATVFGTPDGVLSDVVVIPFNSPERALEILDRHKGEIACVLLDLMPHRVGLVPADARFVSVLREWTAADGSLLVLDEVITFRSEYGGAQTWYPVEPDLTALGKIIGGGFPVGALAGRADVMEVMNPLVDEVLFPHSGTFSANPVTMTAGLTAMELYDRPAVERVNALASRAMRGFREAIEALGAKASVSGAGSMFRLHLKEQVPRDYRAAYMPAEEKRRLAMLMDSLFEDGLILINTATATISTPMTETEVDLLVAGMARGLERITAPV
jgi:glutamate-1-semialdehyde 2,1-aminomutase